MTALSKTYTLTNGTTADASKVEQNFNDIITYVNASTMRVDGTNAMTAALSTDGVAPTAAAHAVPKSYMDGAFVYAVDPTSIAYLADTWTTQRFATETYDYTNGAGNTAAANYTAGVFTAPKTGVYVVSFAITPDVADTRQWSIKVVADSIDYDGPRIIPSTDTTASSCVLGMSVAVRCASGDTIYPQARRSTANNTVSIGKYLTIAWLHA